MVKIIPATVKDVDFVFDCIMELEQHDFPREKFDRIYYSIVESDTGFPFLILHDDKPAGYLSVHIQTLLHHCDVVAEIQELVVLPDFRNKNLGEAAIEFAKKFAKEKGCALIELSCNLKRTNAHRFYLRNGMNQTHYKFTFPLTKDGVQM